MAQTLEKVLDAELAKMPQPEVVVNVVGGRGGGQLPAAHEVTGLVVGGADLHRGDAELPVPHPPFLPRRNYGEIATRMRGNLLLRDPSDGTHRAASIAPR